MALIRTQTQPKTYRLDGDDAERCVLSELPGTTDILAEAGYINKDRYDDFSRDGFHRDRGQFVHEACDLLDQGKRLKPASIDGYVGYIDSYTKASAKLPGPVLATEESFYDRALLYAGTRDRRYTGFVGDLKTAKQTAPWWRLQLAAYAIPLGPPYPGLFDLQLYEDGTEARRIDLKPDQYLAAAFLFLAALARYHASHKLPIRSQEALALAATTHLRALSEQLHGRSGSAVESSIHLALPAREGLLGPSGGDAGRARDDHESCAA